CLGAIVGIGIIVLILYLRMTNFNLGTANLGQNGFAATTDPAVIAGVALTEFVATLVFALVILGATSGKGATPFPGLVIGLTLVAVHIVFINVTGVSVKPARSLGPAVFVGGKALVQLWLFLIVPIVAGAASGWLFRANV